MNNKFLLSISINLILFISPIFAMNEWEPPRTHMINLQKVDTLSKEELQNLYASGHLLSEEGWYHVGKLDGFDGDPWSVFNNWGVEFLRRILVAMRTPNSFVVGCGKQVTEREGMFYGDKSITFHYNLTRGEYHPCYVTLYPGICYFTYNLTKKLQYDDRANLK